MNARKPRRAAIYARVSTGAQTVENQLRELREVAEQHGWIVAEFRDAGISGAKGRDKRPGLDRLLHAVARREIDMVAAWSVDRLRPLTARPARLSWRTSCQECDLYLHQQCLDKSTPVLRETR